MAFNEIETLHMIKQKPLHLPSQRFVFVALDKCYLSKAQIVQFPERVLCHAASRGQAMDPSDTLELSIMSSQLM